MSYATGAGDGDTLKAESEQDMRRRDTMLEPTAEYTHFLSLLTGYERAVGRIYETSKGQGLSAFGLWRTRQDGAPTHPAMG